MSDFYQTLDQLFDHYQQLIGEMRGVLEQEKESLRIRDVPGLEQTTKAKESLAERINGLTADQQDLFKRHNLPTGRGGIDRLFAVLPSSPQVDAFRDKWSKIKELAEQCNEINLHNGAYIALLSQHTQRSLDVLHGRSQSEFVYGRDGARHRPTATRKLLSV
jgi:flagella synthesis protein FlgN